MELGHEIPEFIFQILTFFLESIESEDMVDLFLGLQHFELLDDENSPPQPNMSEYLDCLLNVIGLDLDEVRESNSVFHFTHVNESVHFCQLEMLEILEPIL